jgi:hypothetical protein
VHSDHCAIKIVKLSDPNLRPAFFGREEREMPSVRRPARTVAILIGDEDAFVRWSGALLDGRDARRSTV